MNQIYKKAFYGILLFLFGQQAVYGMPDVKELDPLNLPETNSRIVHTENINSRLEVPLSFKNETLTGSYGKITVNAGGIVDYVSDSIFNNLAEGGKYSEVFRLSTTDNIKIDLPVNIIGTNDSASISKLEYVIDASQNSLFESASGTLWIKDEDTGQSSFVEIIDLDGAYGKLVPVGDCNALATAMEESFGALHDHELLRNRAQDFSISLISDKYLNYFATNEKVA